MSQGLAQDFLSRSELQEAENTACFVLKQQHNYTLLRNFWWYHDNPLFHILAGHELRCKLVYITQKEVLSNNVSLRIKEFSKLFHKCSAEQWIWNKEKKRFTGVVFL